MKLCSSFACVCSICEKRFFAAMEDIVPFSYSNEIYPFCKWFWDQKRWVTPVLKVFNPVLSKILEHLLRTFLYWALYERINMLGRIFSLLKKFHGLQTSDIMLLSDFHRGLSDNTVFSKYYSSHMLMFDVKNLENCLICFLQVFETLV